MNPVTTESKVHRVAVRPRAGEVDPSAANLLADARRVLGDQTVVQTARIYLIEAPLDAAQLQQVAEQLLADPVSQIACFDTESGDGLTIEVHYRPGVMDPVAQSARDAIAEMLPDIRPEQIEVCTGYRYDFGHLSADRDALVAFAQRYLANPVIHQIHLAAYHPSAFARVEPYTVRRVEVPIRSCDEDGLRQLSRQGHLFLNLEEMKAIRAYFRTIDREPTDIELETLAQTWSEHCVHKTFRATIRYRQESAALPATNGQASAVIDFTDRPGHTVHKDGSVTIENLLKSTIAAATQQLRQMPAYAKWLVSVFDDNSGIVQFDDHDAVCIKVETHNHPSAIEPYGGAATGIGGCIRDVLGTGLAARPIANTNVFAVAPPQTELLPAGVIAPARILRQVVAGVRDYGNRMGIPTVNGAVWFHENFLGNPLVFAGCVGLLPLEHCFGQARPGDRIIVLGGATGRDGIHGATFSSAELTDGHAEEFGHAVQIGDPITQKKMMDVILQARGESGSKPLFHAITDCGAGGFSSAVGEMGQGIGATVHLERAPLKYPGLSYTEIWISEAQERMVLAVPAPNVPQLQQLCDAEDVSLCDLGEFGLLEGDQPVLALVYQDIEVGRLSMRFLHEGLPTPVRDAVWPGRTPTDDGESGPIPGAAITDHIHCRAEPLDLESGLLRLLAHPNIASKHWIIRQYDHEVQGSSVIKPLVGPRADGPSDAAVIRPKPKSRRGVAIACGLAPQLSESGGAINGDSYQAALHGIDEAVRNAVCVGADPARIALLDNFCWPSCDDPAQLGSLVRAATACYDGALAYHCPFVSGKDSLNNQFTTSDHRVITIPQTLLITAVGIVNDCHRCITMDAKAPGNLLLVVGRTTADLGGSHLHLLTGERGHISRVDLNTGPATAAAVARLIAEGLVSSAHDCSEGGLLVAAAEMAFAGYVGLDLDLETAKTLYSLDPMTACFAETPSRYLVEITPNHLEQVLMLLREARVCCDRIGTFAQHDRLRLRAVGSELDVALHDLRAAWRGPLDW